MSSSSIYSSIPKRIKRPRTTKYFSGDITKNYNYRTNSWTRPRAGSPLVKEYFPLVKKAKGQIVHITNSRNASWDESGGGTVITTIENDSMIEEFFHPIPQNASPDEVIAWAEELKVFVDTHEYVMKSGNTISGFRRLELREKLHVTAIKAEVTTRQKFFNEKHKKYLEAERKRREAYERQRNMTIEERQRQADDRVIEQAKRILKSRGKRVIIEDMEPKAQKTSRI